MINIRSTYKEYQRVSKKPVDMTTYTQILAKYNKFLVQKVIEGHKVCLPSRLGYLSIVGKKIEIRSDKKGLAPDWVSTKKYWEENPEAKEKKTLLYHLNLHSDMTRYKFRWSKNKVWLKNKSLYNLRMTRANKRAVHKAILAGTEYITY